ncbi:MAG: alpha/beta hydrolase [Halobacteriovoraceae bacterium]|nr:alpha/beta hydrolase [Halobacteriovoraceae bacterium]
MDLAPKNWLLLRGLAREARHWGEFPSMIEDSFSGTKVHFLELPGVGSKVNSPAHPNIKEYTNELRLEWLDLKDQNPGPWGLVAISMGGMIGMDWCARFPHDMNALVLVNSSGGNLSPPHHRFSPSAISTVLKLFFKEDYEEREEAILKLTTRILQPTKELINRYASYSAESPIKRKDFLMQMFAAGRFKVPTELKQQMLILAAKDDKLASFKCSQAIARHFSRIYTLHESAGHDLPLDDPEWIIEQMKGFLSKNFKEN